MANETNQDPFIESVHNELIDAFKRATKSNHAAGMQAAEAAIAHVNDAEAATLTAENSVTLAEAVTDTAT
jgi:hypothetical protein